MDPVTPIKNRWQDILRQLHSNLNLITLLPKIAVIGSQSSGKSCLLEGLVRKQFLPRGNNTSTRCPIILTLNNRPGREEYCQFEHKKDAKFRMEHVESEIRRRMDDLTEGGVSVANDPIRLSVYSNSVPSLTVIDLPGLVKLPTYGQPDDIVQRVEELVLEYISQPDTFILAVSAGDVDIANSEGINFARRVDPTQERTLGVVTKLDRVGNVEDVLAGRKVKLKLGFVGVINRSQQDFDNDVTFDETLAREGQILRDFYGPLADVHGMPFLASRLDEILSTRIRRFFPTVEPRIGLTPMYTNKIAIYDRLRMLLDDDFDRTGTFLGQGRYAVVSKVKLGRDYAALKSYKEIGNSEALNEVVVLRTLQHDNVIRLLGIVNEDFHTQPRVLLEYMPSGSLKRYLTEKDLSEIQLLEVSLNIVDGMSYVHEKKIIHRDLATRNVLLGPTGTCKLADFGFSRVIPENEWGGVHHYLDSELDHIPIKWSPKESIPPKLLRGHKKTLESGRPVYSTASDVWAYGVTMFEIFTKGKDPYDSFDFGEEQGKKDVANSIYHGGNPTKFLIPTESREIIGIMRDIFKLNHLDRPSFPEIRISLEKQINATRIKEEQTNTIEMKEELISEPMDEQVDTTRTTDDDVTMEENLTSNDAKVDQVLPPSTDESLVTNKLGAEIVKEEMVKRHVNHDLPVGQIDEATLNFKTESQFNNPISSTLTSAPANIENDFQPSTPKSIEEDSMIVNNIDPQNFDAAFGGAFELANVIVEKYSSSILRVFKAERISGLHTALKIKMKLRRKPVLQAAKVKFQRAKNNMIQKMIASEQYKGSVENSNVTFLGKQIPKGSETEAKKQNYQKFGAPVHVSNRFTRVKLHKAKEVRHGMSKNPGDAVSSLYDLLL